jgi:hypothetical protein
MRDQDLRAMLLKELYDQRTEDHVQIGLGAIQNPEQSERSPSTLRWGSL